MGHVRVHDSTARSYGSALLVSDRGGLAPPGRPVVMVTGASSGIGAGLASRFHARGAHVIAAARSGDRLRDLAGRHPGLEPVTLDVSDARDVGAAFKAVRDRHGRLDMLINNAGMLRLVDFGGAFFPAPEEIIEEISTNLTGLITVTAAALPLLSAAPRARLVNVGSALGLVPWASAPVYSATKAAVHSFSISLRHQLAGTSVDVTEVIPPVVSTGLHGGQPSSRAMPLEQFLDAAMRGLDSGRPEIYIGLARALRYGVRFAPGVFFGLVNKPV